MALLTKDAIIAAEDLPRELVAVPEWGGEVCVRAMTASERIGYSETFPDPKAPAEQNPEKAMFVAELLVRTLCDEKGELIFPTSYATALARKNGAAAMRLYQAARRLNGLGPEAEDEAAKNSGTTPSDGSPTVSV